MVMQPWAGTAITGSRRAGFVTSRRDLASAVCAFPNPGLALLLSPQLLPDRWRHDGVLSHRAVFHLIDTDIDIGRWAIGSRTTHCAFIGLVCLKI